MILATFRVIILFFYLLFISLFSIIFGIFFCFDHRKSHVYCRLFSFATHLIGLKVEMRGKIDKNKTAVFVSNHQNSYDLLVLTHIVPSGCVSVGKNSLVLIPFFGLIYWLSGNVLINRKNKITSIRALNKTAASMSKKKMSLWLFPEGTRTRGRGILPFKLGAFHVASKAGLPIIPVVASCQDHISLKKIDNGKVIIQVLPEVYVNKEDDMKAISVEVRQQILESYNALNKELSVS